MTALADPPPSPVALTDAQRSSLQSLYDQGRFLEAYEGARPLGPFRSWAQPADLILAGRLARHLGAPALGVRLLLRAWRRQPGCWQAHYFMIWAVLELRGPVAAWQRFQLLPEPPSSNPADRADFFLLRSRIAASLRDFQLADHCLAQAEHTRHEPAWVAFERSQRLESEDRYSEALEIAQSALARHPRHWILSAQTAHALTLVGRDGEALELLRAARVSFPTLYLAQNLYALELELDLFQDALATLEDAQRLAPLAEPSFQEWLARGRATCLYRLGQFEPAALEARRAGPTPSWIQFAARLESPPPEAQRIQLPVPFVRQHHLTCVPATLTTLCRFWNQPVAHLDVADAICYDGTPSHSERNWAERHGWIAREFTVTASAARDLVCRGIPFALTTVQPGNAHEQAVIGYDDFSQCLIIRDPFFRNYIELLAEPGLASQAAYGPRGLAIVPADQASRLEGVELPDADLYDCHHALLLALDRHDRPAAVAARQQLESIDPLHRITRQARRALAHYDANPAEILGAVQHLLDLYPGDVNLLLARTSVLRDMGRRQDILSWLRDVCVRRDSDPLLWQELAWELGQDARQHAAALRWLDRAQRRRPADASACFIRGHILWQQGRFHDACDYYRLATSLDDKKESFATAWFNACRWLKRTSEAIDFLTRRFQKNASQSSLPARTLVRAFLEIDQPVAALAILDQALAVRPEDGSLCLFAAEQFAASHNLERAESLLAHARSRTSAGEWTRAAATLAGRRGDPGAELELWRQILASEPLAIDAHRAAAFLLAETQGRAAALDHLAQAASQFPHYLPLLQLRIEWIRDSGPADLEIVARALVEQNPDDAWARRELATALQGLQRFDEADRQLDAAAALEPFHPALFNIRGDGLLRQGRLPEARAQFAAALQISVDNSFAMHGLIQACAAPADRRQAIDLIQSELIRQTTFGDGILQFAELARPFLSSDDLLQLLRQAHVERPDLWHSWSALARHLISMDRLTEALLLARQMTERFSLLPRAWVDLALVHRARLDHAAEIDALERVRQLNPAWGAGMRELAQACENAGRLADARQVLEQAVQRSAQDPLNHGALAHVLWKLGEPAAALDRIRDAVRIEPGYDWAWSQLDAWSRELGQPGLGLELAQELARQRPGEARSWWLQARMLDRPDQSDQRLAALDQAIARNPRFVEAWRLRATTLALAGRYAEALDCCRPPALGDPPPAELRATSAYIVAQQGDIPEAIRQMRAVLADHPDIDWAWRELASWLDQRGEYAGAVTAAEALARLHPLDPVPWGYAAHSKLRQGNRAGALADFQHAFELDPDYTFAGFHLFDLQVESDDCDGARLTLQRLEGHATEPARIDREIALELRLGHSHAIPPLLERICTRPEDDPAAFQSLAQRLSSPRLSRMAEHHVRRLLLHPSANPNTAWLWVGLRAAIGKLANARILARLPARSELARRALIRQLQTIGQSVSQSATWGVPACFTTPRRQFRRLLRAHAQWFQEDDSLWGQVGYVFTCLSQHRQVAHWLADWRQRSRVEPWMLDNLLIAYQQTGRDTEAQSLIRDARALPRHEGGFTRFDLFSALEDAFDLNPEPGRHVLSIINEESLDWYERCLVDYLRTGLQFLEDSPSSPVFTRHHRKQLASLLARTHHYRAARQTFHRLATLASRQSNRSWPRWWAAAKLLRYGHWPAPP